MGPVQGMIEPVGLDLLSELDPNFACAFQPVKTRGKRANREKPSILQK